MLSIIIICVFHYISRYTSSLHVPLLSLSTIYCVLTTISTCDVDGHHGVTIVKTVMLKNIIFTAISMVTKVSDVAEICERVSIVLICCLINNILRNKTVMA